MKGIVGFVVKATNLVNFIFSTYLLILDIVPKLNFSVDGHKIGNSKWPPVKWLISIEDAYLHT